VRRDEAARAYRSRRMRLRLDALVALALAAFGEIPATAEAERPELLYEVDGLHLHAAGFVGDGELLLTREAADFSRGELVAVAYPPRAGEAPRALALGGDAKGATRRDGGAELIFTSSRPTGLPLLPDDWNLWSARRDGDTWTVAPLPFPVSSPFADCCAVAAPDGALLFASDRAGTWDLFRAEPAADGWRVARLPGRVNSEPPEPGARGYFGEWPSFVDPRGRFLLLSSIRPGGFGGDDLYVACRADGGGWGEPRNLGAPINGPGYEDGAVVTPAGDALLWSSRREGETSRVYRLPLDVARLCSETDGAR
jgi:hypothetical protein